MIKRIAIAYLVPQRPDAGSDGRGALGRHPRGHRHGGRDGVLVQGRYKALSVGLLSRDELAG